MTERDAAWDLTGTDRPTLHFPSGPHSSNSQLLKGPMVLVKSVPFLFH